MSDAGRRARERHGISADAVVFGCYGGLSPDKRLPQVLAAFAATRAYICPRAHLLLAGAVRRRTTTFAATSSGIGGLGSDVTLTGYVPSDEAFTESIAACDVALNLRWPTAREMSGPWLRCLAAGKPTVIVDLAHMANVPTLDPRTWQPNGVHGVRSPCAVAIDILDEDHSLRLAMRRLGTDPLLRATLGRGRRDIGRPSTPSTAMVADYRQRDSRMPF